jgi:hypothetical protein
MTDNLDKPGKPKPRRTPARAFDWPIEIDAEVAEESEAK